MSKPTKYYLVIGCFRSIPLMDAAGKPVEIPVACKETGIAGVAPMFTNLKTAKKFVSQSERENKGQKYNIVQVMGEA